MMNITIYSNLYEWVSKIMLSGMLFGILASPVIGQEISQPDDQLASASTKKEAHIRHFQETITGVVTDAQTGETLPGVNILVKGTSTGASTDANGQYELIVESLQDTLVVSFVGYQTQEIAIDGNTEINISLQSQAITGEEMVVVGYSSEKRANITGAVNSISAEEMDEISDRPVSNVSQALQGVSPNLNINESGYSAEPGGEMDINIRGLGSLTGDDSPYILVDGVPVDLNSINPNDIESISVLKGPAASAIYGSRAAYGVIQITTKQGRMGQNPKISYSTNISFSSPIGRPHMENSLKSVTAYNQGLQNAGLEKAFDEYNIERIKQYQAGEIEEETWATEDNRWAGADGWQYYGGNANNDWMYLYYKDRVMRQKHNISISGGSDNTSYFFSGGLWNQPGELIYGNQHYNRYNVTANVETEVADWISFNSKVKYIEEGKQRFQSGQPNWDREIFYHNLFRTHSFRPRKLPNGEYSPWSWIPTFENAGSLNNNTSQIILSGMAKIEPVKNWLTKIRYNYKNIDTKIDDNKKTVTGHRPDGTVQNIAYPISNSGSDSRNTNYKMANIVSSYTKDIGEHHFYILGGYEYERNEYNRLWGRRNNMITSSVPSISTSVGDQFINDAKSLWVTEGFFGRFQYNYNEKYLFEVNGRYDGTSKFQKGNRWGLFPSVSAGYNIAKEDFWRSISALSFVESFKLRGSWGSLGNQNVPNYLYLPTMNINTQLGWIMGNNRPTYTTSPSLISPDLTWEKVTTTNVGLDASFLDGRLSATVDFYKRITSNMFGPAEALPQLLGASPPRRNNASLQTKGYELQFEWRDQIGDWSYNIKTSLADNVTEVTDYNNPTKSLSTYYEGQKIGEIWGLETVGLYQTDEEAANGPDQSSLWSTWGGGDVHYKDINGDGKITRGDYTAENAGDYHVIGNTSPRYSLGFNAGFEWKGISFNMLWQGYLKRDYAFRSKDMTFFGFRGNQQWNTNFWHKDDATTLDYWRPEDETNLLGPNTDSYYPKPYISTEDYKNKEPQTRYMQSAAYMRLRNVSIGYTFPTKMLENIHMSKASVFISGENLLVISPLTDLIDPEALNMGGNWGTGKGHFLRKVFSIGVNLTF